jgi:hypothetical protein
MNAAPREVNYTDWYGPRETEFVRRFWEQDFSRFYPELQTCFDRDGYDDFGDKEEIAEESERRL